MTALPQLFAEIPAPFAALYDPEAPWKLLGDALDEVLAALPDSELHVKPLPEVLITGNNVVICPGVRLHPNVVIEGPVFIGRGVEVRPGAYIRAGVWIGDGCTVGANVEVKRAILFPGAKAPHLNYVGDSILGHDVNLGAGTVLSNFRHDAREIRIGRGGPLSGRTKLGAVLGDRVLTGCNSVLNPGVVIGRGTQIHPGVVVPPGFYAEDSVIREERQVRVTPK